MAKYAFNYDSGEYEYIERDGFSIDPVSYTHLRAHETGRNLVCRLLLEKKKKIRLDGISAWMGYCLC